MTPLNIPTIIVCDRNRFLAESICKSFCASGSLIGLTTVDCDATLMELVAASESVAVLIDPSIIKGRSADFVAALITANENCRAVAYFAQDAAPRAAECLRDGFAGAVSQQASIEHLEDAMRMVCLGSIYVDPVIVDRTISGSCGRPAHTKCGLSEREHFVLKHVARGLTHKEIALLLDLSAKTVETYKLRGTHKLGLFHKSDIVDYALRHDWLT